MSDRHEVYADHAATTPPAPEVIEAMRACLGEDFGNASSVHRRGEAAKEQVEAARERVAELIGATPEEIVFTASGSEANNLALKGVALGATSERRRLVVSATEHPSVLEAARHLESRGVPLTIVPVTRQGVVDLDRLREEVGRDVALVSVQAANNETGVLQPIREIAEIAHAAGTRFHTDAVQAVGKVPFNVNDAKVDLVSMSGHKFYGPKGVGALYVRRRNPRVLLAEQISGGGHERGMRSGTLNVPGIVGLGAAAALANAEMATESERLRTLRDRLNKKLHANLDELYINGSMEHRLPHNLNVSFAYVEGESLLMGINDVAVSSGSACTSASLEPSYVLKALGAGDDLAHSSIRFGLGRWSTEEEVDYVVEKLTTVVRRLREMSPLYEMVKEGVDLSKMQWVTH